ncbi:hypothetical protein Adt_05255 [Abeliophyllum distichum]|uniref:Uncharacterized protein n=1 Tax=Abeliophyllum distichum TaxID=126358 RepID=A0ABD1V3L7_9LAMI
MEYAVDRRLCDFTGKVTANFNITNIKRVENGLNKHHKAMLRQSFFWKFHQGDNKVARFSLMEFLIVTGLNADNEDKVWAFKAIPMLANKWAIRKDWTIIPRMLNWQATDIPTAKDVATILDDPQPMIEIRHLNKKVEQLSKKVDEVIEWVRPLHYTNTMAPETTLDRVLIESNRMRDQEVNMEMKTREIPKFQTGVQTDMETQIEISHPDIETKGVTDGEPVKEKDGKRNEVVTKTSEQLDVEAEKMTNEELAIETDGVTDRMVTGGQRPVGETEQLLMKLAMGS